jgi:uncharacterized protein with GYD domain
MAKFLLKASYTTEGVKGVLSGGGSARREAVESMVEGLGGTVEAFYFAFGDADVYVIIDVPDGTTAAAISMAVNGSGAVQVATVPLLTTEDIDEAAKKSVDFRPPGA